MTSEEHIIFRLNQQDRSFEDYRKDVKIGLADVAQIAHDHRDEMKKTMERVFDQFSKSNTRITSLERFQWLCTGALIVISAFIGWYVTWNPHK